jgi:hypothetical protein
MTQENIPMCPLTDFGTPVPYKPKNEVDVLDSYDSMPLITILRDPDTDEMWLEMWIDISEDRKVNRWIHTKLSEERIDEYLACKISLRTVFKETQECVLVENDPSATGEPGAAWAPAICIAVPTTQVPESYFSMEDSYRDPPQATLTVEEDVEGTYVELNGLKYRGAQCPPKGTTIVEHCDYTGINDRKILAIHWGARTGCGYADSAELWVT